MRRRFGRWLHKIADRIDYNGAYRHPGLSFTIEHGVGLVVHDDERGCLLWYRGDDYDRAYEGAGRDPYLPALEPHFNGAFAQNTRILRGHVKRVHRDLSYIDPNEP